MYLSKRTSGIESTSPCFSGSWVFPFKTYASNLNKVAGHELYQNEIITAMQVILY